MEETGIDTKAAFQEFYKGRGVKDSWFTSYIRGNSRVPQTLRAGIGLMMANAVVHDLPDSWRGFFDSKFTENQVRLAGKAMDGHHKQSEVRYSTKPVLSKDATLTQRIMSHIKGEKKYQVQPEQLQQLWTSSTKMTGRIILGYMHGRHYPEDHVLEARDVADIKTFFANPQNADRVDQFKQTLQLASDALTDDVGMKITDNYKKAVTTNAAERERWLGEITQHSLAAVQEHFPDEKMEWLYGDSNRENH